ncbi:TetR/AcrR family transcriptional regulator [Paracoccus sp. 11-3]|uniref:TetR/AcrR family transcriptional regulator n=1 Tax=Paracoccus amoyensis TaxID=2760093 RepID=A0A926GHJ3_9RHOB|nr:TetR/AcrR family transcriptional regulator [Paracoccus amoyensis]MBC9247444.1 TetR/AcrR family transcriptional regulator [Paracoccus amoyensis]
MTDPAAQAPRLNVRGAARHEQILDAATQAFLDRGFDAVSLDEILRVSGGSKTNVYKQFGDKNGLFTQIVHRLAAEFLSPLTALDLGQIAQETGLGILGRTLMRQLMQPRHIAFQRMVMAVSRRMPHLMAEWYRVGPKTSQAVIADFLGGGPNAQRDAVLFHDMIVTDAVNHALMGDPPDWAEIEARIDRAARMIGGKAIDA